VSIMLLMYALVSVSFVGMWFVIINLLLLLFCSIAIIYCCLRVRVLFQMLSICSVAVKETYACPYCMYLYPYPVFNCNL
jgi:hypothetical protein